MDIHQIIRQIATINDAEVFIGRGPRHPSTPDPTLEGIIQEYLEVYPFLRQDHGYIDFVESYAGLYVYREAVDVVVGIFGFCYGISSLIEKTDQGFLWQGESSVVVDGFLVLSDVSLVLEEKRGYQTSTELVNNVVGAGFGFDTLGSRPWGVYRKNDVDPSISRTYYPPIRDTWYWYCSSFTEWLQILLDTKGNFPDRPVEA